MLACGIAAAWTGCSPVPPPSPRRLARSGARRRDLRVPLCSHVSLPADIAGRCSPSRTWAIRICADRDRRDRNGAWTAGVHGPAVSRRSSRRSIQDANAEHGRLHGAQPLRTSSWSRSFCSFSRRRRSDAAAGGALRFSRVPRFRRVGRATLVPALFNLNEPLLFAVPVVSIRIWSFRSSARQSSSPR